MKYELYSGIDVNSVDVMLDRGVVSGMSALAAILEELELDISLDHIEYRNGYYFVETCIPYLYLRFYSC